MVFDSREFLLRDKVIAALNSSLNLSEVMERVRGLFLELIPAEYMGLCIVAPGQPIPYRWLVPGPRVPLLEQSEYDKVADDDFVRRALLRQLDTVLRDSEMVSRRELEASQLYQRSQELELRLEHVMAVLMNVRPGVFGGFTLYRDRRHPFSERAVALLTSLTPHLANTVRNCGEMWVASTGVRLLEQIHENDRSAFIVVDPPALERLRSPRATTLLEQWFTRSDLHGSGLPEVLVDRLVALTRMSPDERLQANVWVRSLDDSHRVVKFIELPEPQGPSPWALILHEIPHSIPLPEQMKRRLTSRQVTITQALLRNWSNEQIAREYGLSIDTVKTHIRDIFSTDRLNCDSRADFLYQAARLMKPI
ncbi:LuxR C-terminal-related transcriptional regulator [Myxococcus sp. CA039A]|uniref:LuxR C-terminal-related transcriptional regulator n=1 Tax=Myxococcus sp. CA039A TaxID=2741737 RepID=UPI00157AA04B|nr:LuxR C-terminal-related transcriptional regulator [Myxococcus sp. CA039A]NTX56172.1 response regulator transcription factor [Myxococcus sp. CA039A]